MFEITVSGNFSSAHNLRHYQGKCEKLHGHNWRVDVTVCGKPDTESGMVIDFGILKRELEKILEKLDHAYLNDIDYFKKANPSSENIAFFIFKKLEKSLIRYGVKVRRVTVWENERQRASYCKLD
ncbi:MAG: 6-carboxytetrahydropterin synthase QueD [Candidatus Omnitrophica bacterium]|nr:6-carboxytetrahydropterin synthase QueD [Candidatus Omnitrophota bacterium]MCM8828024.1 6-carboxytetrahydropterin synthase QueD [Candidatus Omnitrophota bacterium]